MRFGVESADGFDFVAEEFEAVRALGLWRVNVEDATASSELALHFDQVHLCVAMSGEVLGEHLDVNLLAHTELERLGCVVASLEEAHGGGFDGSDYELCSAGGDLPQNAGTLFEHVRVWREVFKGKHVVRGEAKDVLWWECAGEFAGCAQGKVHGICCFVVCDQQKDRFVGGAGKEGKEESACGYGESGHTSATDVEAEVPANAFKGLSVFKLFEQLPYKRQNHAKIECTNGWKKKRDEVAEASSRFHKRD
jgi:hypothetical protein